MGQDMAQEEDEGKEGDEGGEGRLDERGIGQHREGPLGVAAQQEPQGGERGAG